MEKAPFFCLRSPHGFHLHRGLLGSLCNFPKYLDRKLKRWGLPCSTIRQGRSGVALNFWHEEDEVLLVYHRHIYQHMVTVIYISLNNISHIYAHIGLGQSFDNILDILMLHRLHRLHRLQFFFVHLLLIRHFRQIGASKVSRSKLQSPGGRWMRTVHEYSNTSQGRGSIHGTWITNRINWLSQKAWETMIAVNICHLDVMHDPSKLELFRILSELFSCSARILPIFGPSRPAPSPCFNFSCFAMAYRLILRA